MIDFTDDTNDEAVAPSPDDSTVTCSSSQTTENNCTVEDPAEIELPPICLRTFGYPMRFMMGVDDNNQSIIERTPDTPPCPYRVDLVGKLCRYTHTHTYIIYIYISSTLLSRNWK